MFETHRELQTDGTLAGTKQKRVEEADASEKEGSCRKRFSAPEADVDERRHKESKKAHDKVEKRKLDVCIIMSDAQLAPEKTQVVTSSLDREAHGSCGKKSKGSACQEETKCVMIRDVLFQVCALMLNVLVYMGSVYTHTQEVCTHGVNICGLVLLKHICRTPLESVSCMKHKRTEAQS
jgi:hypothetical protein